MVTSTYSNILLSESTINMTQGRVENAATARPRGLFEVLARNRQSAVGRGRAYKERDENGFDPECAQYLLDNNCPLPFGWVYEDGELRVSE